MDIYVHRKKWSIVPHSGNCFPAPFLLAAWKSRLVALQLAVQLLHQILPSRRPCQFNGLLGGARGISKLPGLGEGGGEGLENDRAQREGGG